MLFAESTCPALSLLIVSFTFMTICTPSRRRNTSCSVLSFIRVARVAHPMRSGKHPSRDRRARPTINSSVGVLCHTPLLEAVGCLDASALGRDVSGTLVTSSVIPCCCSCFRYLSLLLKKYVSLFSCWRGGLDATDDQDDLLTLGLSGHCLSLCTTKTFEQDRVRITSPLRRRSLVSNQAILVNGPMS